MEICRRFKSLIDLYLDGEADDSGHGHQQRQQERQTPNSWKPIHYQRYTFRTLRTAAMRSSASRSAARAVEMPSALAR